MACRRWTWWAASWAARAAPRRWRCSALLTGWIAENEKDEALAPYVKGVKRGVETLAGRHHVAGAERPARIPMMPARARRTICA